MVKRGEGYMNLSCGAAYELMQCILRNNIFDPSIVHLLLERTINFITWLFV